jgi:hypothetical protein
MTFVAAWMAGHELPGVIEAEPIGEEFQVKALGGVERRDGVAVGIHHDATAVGGAHDAHHARVGGERWERF